ncbi:MAG TPA: VOC family protein [Saprospiraceae bacterium]|nr:VOC family protein [Saprospiraceae bacterium]
MTKVISGIQQIGIGIPNVHEAWGWYNRHFGFDLPMFDEAAEAGLMLPYTDGKPQQRHAILALNLKGGGGFEIWQYTSRTPQPADFELQLGDLGIFITKIKTSNVSAAYKQLAKNKTNLLSEIVKMPNGDMHFFVEDPYGNIFQIVSANSWFRKSINSVFGGAYGAIIGVTDMAKSMAFYNEILGYDTVVFDEEGVFEDLSQLPGGNKKIHRVLLKHSKERQGAFSKLLGPSTIELVKVLDRAPQKIFENRLWGDLGFIHLCFDIRNMQALKKECENFGHPFTVDSADSFDMGEAAGHFAYIEDPDGALIEFVETHKIPIAKKWGLYKNLKKRNPTKALPDWMLGALRFNRVKL